MFLHKVRVNGINWTEGKKKFVRVSEVFELIKRVRVKRSKLL